MASTRKLSDEDRKQRRKETVARYYKKHRNKCVKARKLWRDNNPCKVSEGKLRTLYGITREEWLSCFSAQASVCAICKTDVPTKRGWMTDHCHTTGKFRGILCQHCNTALGGFKDDPSILFNAISYLKAN